MHTRSSVCLSSERQEKREDVFAVSQYTHSNKQKPPLGFGTLVLLSNSDFYWTI